MLDTGWLSPTGEFFRCQTYEHIAVARKLSGDDYRADETLMKRGFVQISISLLSKKEWAIFWGTNHRLTPEQTRFLRPYFEDKEAFPVCFSAKCRWDRNID